MQPVATRSSTWLGSKRRRSPLLPHSPWRPQLARLAAPRAAPAALRLQSSARLRAPTLKHTNSVRLRFRARTHTWHTWLWAALRPQALLRGGEQVLRVDARARGQTGGCRGLTAPAFHAAAGMGCGRRRALLRVRSQTWPRVRRDIASTRESSGIILIICFASQAQSSLQ